MQIKNSRRKFIRKAKTEDFRLKVRLIIKRTSIKFATQKIIYKQFFNIVIFPTNNKHSPNNQNVSNLNIYYFRILIAFPSINWHLTYSFQIFYIFEPPDFKKFGQSYHNFI